MAGIRKHILLFPGPFFGHYIPMLEFAKKAAEHHDVTIVVPSSKMAGIRDRNLLPPVSIKVVSFEDGLTVDLDENFSLHAMMKVSNQLRPIYDKIIAELPLPGEPQIPNCLLDQPIAPVDAVFWDIFFHAVVIACHNRRIPNHAVAFMPPNFMNVIYRITEAMPTVPDEEHMSGKPIPPGMIPVSLKENYVECNRNMHKCNGVLFNSFEELDPAWEAVSKHLADAFKIPTYFVGPLLPEDEPKRTKSSLTRWLDAQPENSVVYFSFGTIGKTSAAQLEEIGKALLSLNKPFIWSLRQFQQDELSPSYKKSATATIDPEAPYLILPWVPQREILPHPAIAVFGSHCGWNSVLEAVYNGVPIAGWGFFADQPRNAMLVEKVGFGLRFGDTGYLTQSVMEAEGIATVIQKVAGWDEGSGGRSIYREVAKKLQLKARESVTPNGKAAQNLQKILQSI